MITVERVLIRHKTEAQFLSEALAGDAGAVKAVIQSLYSDDPDGRQAMQQTMHDLMDANLCMYLISCLGTGRWAEHWSIQQHLGAQTECIDEALLSVLSTDEYVWESAIKDSVLQEALKHADERIRVAAACTLGMRGEGEIIPALEEAVENAKPIWKLRAIRALGALNDARCASALIKALTLDQGVYHTAAVQALNKLGCRAEPAWRAAMNDQNSHIRWHAACGLGDLGDAGGAPLLAEALFDEDSHVRWASVEALTHLGKDVIPAMLNALSCHPDPNPGRQAVFQALKGAALNCPQERARLKPLMECLHLPDACKEAPAVAGRILRE